MEGKWTGKKLEAFCRAFLRSLDAEAAAREVGREDGYALLRDEAVRKRLQEIRRTAAPTREDVLRRLGQMAFGGDSTPLPLEPGALPRAVELAAVSEMKVTDKGVELKLIDRVRALETLWGLLDEADDGKDGLEAFLKGLRDADGKEDD